ncbi:hypothetical protein BDK51DRAFT_41013 [Blyttiomyces helicus]|uniref:Uncharacterized protein n=1 Tax=Blyttiomyces helicus TaxID=388810 RepID=A0A4P9W870_9FUNG|nr:hypothetical protein BDK51DRAFT_41013 [Blyttiomyces helicus]|eukprot:RKO88524.1 hypothetical protein BDK51DRAFT_41013 [Blyttiomyces helicus]
MGKTSALRLQLAFVPVRPRCQLEFAFGKGGWDHVTFGKVPDGLEDGHGTYMSLVTEKWELGHGPLKCSIVAARAWKSCRSPPPPPNLASIFFLVAVTADHDGRDHRILAYATEFLIPSPRSKDSRWLGHDLHDFRLAAALPSLLQSYPFRKTLFGNHSSGQQSDNARENDPLAAPMAKWTRRLRRPAPEPAPGAHAASPANSDHRVLISRVACICPTISDLAVARPRPLPRHPVLLRDEARAITAG